MRKLTFFVLLLSSLFLVACGEPAEREAKYVERARVLFEKGDYEKALIALINAQQIVPAGIESTYYQGLIAEAEGDLSGALSKFQKVYERDSTHLRAMLKIGNIYLITNMLDLAEDMADQALVIAPDNADLGALRAGIALRRENRLEAQKLAEAVLAAHPAHIAAAGILARILSDRGDVGDALKVLETAIRLNPKNQNLRRVKILLHLENGDLPAAEKLYHELFALAPDFFDYRKELVRQYIAYGQLDDGEEVLRDLIAEFPTDIKPKQLLVDFLLNQRSFAAAEQEMLTFLAEDPENNDLRLDLAGIYVTHGQLDKAEMVYRDVLQSAASDKHVVLAQVGLARTLLDLGKITPAAKLLDKVLKDDPENGTAMLLRSRLYLAEDDYSRAILNLRTFMLQEPSATAGLVFLAQAHLMAKEPGLAIDALQRLIEMDPTNDRAALLLASLLARRGDLDEAYPLVTEVVKRNPGNKEALTEKFRILLVSEDWDEAESVAREVRGLSGGAVLGHELFGRLYRRQARFAEAAAEFRAALAIDPSREAALAGLTMSYLAEDRAADAEVLLQDRLVSRPDDALAYKLLGDTRQERAGSVHAAMDAYRKAITLRPSWSEPYLRLALLHREEGDSDKMVAVLERGLENAPGDEALKIALASGYEDKGDPLQAIEIYEKMAHRNADNVVVANNLVALVSDYDFENEARLSMAEKLTASFEETTQPALLDTLGWVHYRLGNYELALSYLEKALSSGGDTPQIRYHLGMVYLELGKAEQARQELEMAVQSDTKFPGLGKAREALAEL